MSKEHGIKETKEALVALAALGAFVAKRLKDGADWGDAVALGKKLIEDADFREKVEAGVQGMDMVDGEIKDLSLEEGLELAKIIPQILEEIQNV